MKSRKIISGHIATIETSVCAAIGVTSIHTASCVFGGCENSNLLPLLLFATLTSFLYSTFFDLQFIELDYENGLLTIRNFKSLFRKVTVPLSAIEAIEWRPWQSIPSGVMDLLFVRLKKSTINKYTELMILNERLGSPFGANKSDLFQQVKDFSISINPKIKVYGLFLKA